MYIIKTYKLKYPIILDGEAASTDHKISSIMTQLRRIKDIDTSKLRLYLFDIILNNTKFKDRHNIISSTISKLKEAYSKKDISEVKTLTEEVNQKFQTISQNLYNTSSSNDEVKDQDFEKIQNRFMQIIEQEI